MSRLLYSSTRGFVNAKEQQEGQAWIQRERTASDLGAGRSDRLPQAIDGPCHTRYLTVCMFKVRTDIFAFEFYLYHQITGRCSVPSTEDLHCSLHLYLLRTCFSGDCQRTLPDQGSQGSNLNAWELGGISTRHASKKV